jgi:DNA-binding CsgD family transcriptional regulator
MTMQTTTPTDATLTQTERKYACRLLLGLTAAEIADELGVSVETADWHIARLRSKTGIGSGAAVAYRLLSRGLVRLVDVERTRQKLLHAGAEIDEPSCRPLSGREREVLARMLLGLSAESIAATLGVGYETVRTHKKSLRRKTGRASGWAVAAAALAAGEIGELDVFRARRDLHKRPLRAAA